MKVNCPKCSGTGFIARFASTQNGVCFDCGGRGFHELGQPKGKTARASAAALGDAVIDGAEVDKEQAIAAFEIFEDITPRGWSNKDYDRRNALGRLIGRVI